jgi:hypothetical protein
MTQEGIRYLVIGGVAVNLHGLARMTLDLDIAISTANENRAAFHELMKRLGFRMRNEGVASRALLGDTLPDEIRGLTFFREESEIIDVFLRTPIDFDEAYEERELFNAGDFDIAAVSYRTLISMKRESGRDKDLIDVGYLERIRRIMEQ